MNLLLLPWWTPGPSMPFRRTPVRTRRHKEVVLICAFNPCTFLPFPRTHTHHRQAKQSHGVNSSNLVNNSILSCPSRFMISAVCFFPKYEKLVAVELKNQSTNSSRHCYTKFKIPAGDFGPGISLQNIGFSFFYLRHTFFYYSPFRNYLSVFSAMYTK